MISALVFKLSDRLSANTEDLGFEFRQLSFWTADSKKVVENSTE